MRSEVATPWQINTVILFTRIWSLLLVVDFPNMISQNRLWFASAPVLSPIWDHCQSTIRVPHHLMKWAGVWRARNAEFRNGKWTAVCIHGCGHSGYCDLDQIHNVVFAKSSSALSAWVAPTQSQIKHVRPVSSLLYCHWNQHSYLFFRVQKSFSWNKLKFNREYGLKYTYRLVLKQSDTVINIVDLLNIMFHAPMGRFQLELMYYFTYFTNICMFHSCRPFVVLTTKGLQE